MNHSEAELAAPGESTAGFYNSRFAPAVYDAVAATVFLPFGGLRRLRATALDGLDLRPGMRVLELGCGSGGITRMLVRRGVDVTAVDGSQRMLDRARRRAPQASFAQARLEAFEGSGSYHRVLFAFVLHELNAQQRSQAIAAALRCLAPDGRIAILDHAVPATRGLAKAWRAMLLRLEPPTVVHCITQGYEVELAAQGIEVISRQQLAGGTAQLVSGRRMVQ